MALRVEGTKALAETTVDKLADDMAEAILSGEFAPGSRLDEQLLAQRYAVSRTPVREALRQLATTGLIEVRPRRGAIVTQVTPAQLEELFVAMGELEATCARLAAMSMLPTERRRLQALHERMGVLARQGDALAFADCNHDLHTMIYAGAHNGVLADMTQALRRRLAPFRRAQFHLEGRLPRSLSEHDAVIAAIVRGDAAGAHTAMLHHVTLVERSFEELCEEQVRNP
ncbi:GntR family transcriptional regulator [Flavisphingomonas formosensis]|uniref:GntR family transcriptional regulator n=1 Tax=Flavisphingomonas formosensis TaxID=861534 RepID=UPI0012FBA499|nr:GntR family transcriptional regulator [Sphingomonas formosensis]